MKDMNQITQYDVRPYDCRFPVVIASCGGYPQVVVINSFITNRFGIGKLGIHVFHQLMKKDVLIWKVLQEFI